MISKGLIGKSELIVSEQDTAAAVGSGTLNVLATPKVAALMELTAWKSLGDGLEEGATTVGTFLSLSHLAPTPVGARVQCESCLEEINGKELTFRLTASDGSGIIARAEHKRVIVNTARFLSKAESRTN
ncbi:MAG: thioesterase family protein [Clostridium sp.]|nr:thioesterase family protein [Clostridium sp.]